MNLAETHNKEGYFSPTEFEAMKRIESEEKKARRLAAFRPLVYICSPYRGNTNENIENARKYSRFCGNTSQYSHCTAFAFSAVSGRYPRGRKANCNVHESCASDKMCPAVGIRQQHF